jgi:hypothetical protein
MDRLVSTEENKKFTDNEGNITEYAVDYLNAKMSIAHPDIDVSDLDIKLDTIIDSVINN